MLSFAAKIQTNLTTDFYYDESNEYWTAHGISPFGEEVQYKTLKDVFFVSRDVNLYGPAFPLLLHLWLFFGKSVFFSKLLILILHAFLLFVFYQLLLKIGVSKERAVFYTALFSLNPWMHWHAIDLRAYELAFLWMLLTAFYVVPDSKKKKTDKFIFSWPAAIFLSLGLWTLYASWIFLITVAGFYFVELLFQNKKAQKIFFKESWLPAGFVFLNILLMWFSTAKFQMGHSNPSYISYLNPQLSFTFFYDLIILIPKLFLWFLFGNWNFLNELTFYIGPVLIYLPLTFIAFYYLGKAWIKDKNQKRYKFFYFVLFSNLFLGIVLSCLGKYPIGDYRFSTYLIPWGLICFILSFEWIFKSKKETLHKISIVIICLLVLLSHLYSVFQISDRTRHVTNQLDQIFYSNNSSKVTLWVNDVANWGMIKQYFYVRSKKMYEMENRLRQYPAKNENKFSADHLYLWQNNPQVQPYGFELLKVK